MECPYLTGNRLLVAEDNELDQMLIESMPMETGAELLIVESGREAIEQCGSWYPDLVFMDIPMPVMDGRQACRGLSPSVFLSNLEMSV